MFTFLKIVLSFLILLISFVLATYLLIPFICLCGYLFFRIFRMQTPLEKKEIIYNKNFSFGLIITAHQDYSMVPPLIDSILKQTYGFFKAYVVLDDTSPNILKINNPKVVNLEPNQPLNSKIGSISFAIDNFQELHDVIIIVDADNLLDPGYLFNVNKYFQKGYQVVQTNFRPKNNDTVFARLDAIGDMFNFFIERQVRYYFNISSTIWGSGVAIDAKLYNKAIYKDSLGGFDRKLQAYLVTKVERIAFSEEAILYDEKISTGKSLETQRTRWINSYFKYFKESAEIFFKGIKAGNFNLIYFGFNVMRPPLFLTISLFMVLTGITYFISPIYTLIGCIIIIVFVSSFTLIVLIKGGFSYLKTMLYMPLFILRQFMALRRIGEAKKSFMKTSHSNVIYIDEILSRNTEANK